MPDKISAVPAKTRRTESTRGVFLPEILCPRPNMNRNSMQIVSRVKSIANRKFMGTSFLRNILILLCQSLPQKAIEKWDFLTRITDNPKI